MLGSFNLLRDDGLRPSSQQNLNYKVNLHKAIPSCQRPGRRKPNVAVSCTASPPSSSPTTQTQTQHPRMAAEAAPPAGSSPSAPLKSPPPPVPPSAGPPGAFSTGQDTAAAARQKLFNRIAPVYDELNSRLSLGQHWVWKKMAVKWSGAAEGHVVLDLCCGSGDVAALLAHRVGHTGKVVGVDFAAEMLEDAALRQKQKEEKTGKMMAIEWVQGDALQLPFTDGVFDAATMSYGLRNVADIPTALREIHRVLKPGARVAILDFNNCSNPLVDGFQGWALENVVVPSARSYGLAAEYEYLRPSIKAFPTGQRQEQMAVEAGFDSAVHYEIAFGLMGVLVASKA